MDNHSLKATDSEQIFEPKSLVNFKRSSTKEPDIELQPALIESSSEPRVELESAQFDGLCASCTKIHIGLRPRTFMEYFDVLSNWVWEPAEGCPLCEFLQKTGVPSARNKGMLLERDTAYEELFGRPVMFRLINDEGYISASIGCTLSRRSSNDSIDNASFRVVPPMVQIETLKLYLEFCGDDHKSVVESGKFLTAAILVIDCESRQLIPAPPKCQYLALSYVWGGYKQQSMPNGATLTSVPQTIEDAITVTLQLGFRYLWVDMYCINQADEKGKGDQIRHMDLVYRKAYATIFAAAGEDPFFGLPGVSSPRRPCQISVNLGE